MNIIQLHAFSVHNANNAAAGGDTSRTISHEAMIIDMVKWI